MKFPKEIWTNYKIDGKTPYKTDEHNNILQAANCLLIRHAQGNVLVETGLHDKTPNYVKHHNIVKNPSLIESMNIAGVKPFDVDIVINSHLNPDHAGWNTRRKRSIARDFCGSDARAHSRSSVSDNKG